jgi:microcystin-dependent protein
MPYLNFLTQQGQDGLSEAQTGRVVTFTRLGLSDQIIEAEIGAVLPLEPDDIDVIVYSGIASVVRDRPSQCTITSKLRLADVPHEFPLGTIAILAKIDEDPEILWGVCLATQAMDIIRPGGGASTTETTFRVSTIIGNAPNVTAVFDPDIELINIGPPAAGAGLFSYRLGAEFYLKRLASDPSIDISESASLVTLRGAPRLPTGTMVPYAGDTPPQNWLLCAGQAVSRISYTDLFLVCGERYGAGNGTTTFNIPDCRDRTLVGASGSKPLGHQDGAETHALSVAELAPHSHGVSEAAHGHLVDQAAHAHGVTDPAHRHRAYYEMLYYNPAFSGGGDTGYNITAAWEDTTDAWTGIAINAANANIGIFGNTTGLAIQNAGGGAAHNNMQPYLVINYIIYAGLIGAY